VLPVWLARVRGSGILPVSTTGEWLPISYREFHDVPRAFFVHSARGWLFFDCAFHDDADDYRPEYEVDLLGDKGPDDFPTSWSEVARDAVERVGTVPVASVRFGETRRAALHAETLSPLGL
jgi:hypothetical protein